MMEGENGHLKIENFEERKIIMGENSFLQGHSLVLKRRQFY